MRKKITTVTLLFSAIGFMSLAYFMLFNHQEPKFIQAIMYFITAFILLIASEYSRD